MFGKFLWRILQHRKLNPRLPVWNCVRHPTKLAQITVLEASKMKYKSSMTDGVHQNGATVKNVKRYQPDKNARAVTKFRQLRHLI